MEFHEHLHGISSPVHLSCAAQMGTAAPRIFGCSLGMILRPSYPEDSLFSIPTEDSLVISTAVMM